MKIRLICRAGYQITEDSFNTAYRTFVLEIPDNIVKESMKEKHMNWLNNIMGVEVLYENSVKTDAENNDEMNNEMNNALSF